MNTEMDKAAEIDSAYFWKKINFRRNMSISHAGNVTEFNGRIRRDPEDIANGWGEYFHHLYSDTERSMSIPPSIKKFIHVYNIYDTNYRDSDYLVITAEHVKSYIRSHKTRRACGKDIVYNAAWK